MQKLVDRTHHASLGRVRSIWIWWIRVGVEIEFLKVIFNGWPMYLYIWHLKYLVFEFKQGETVIYILTYKSILLLSFSISSHLRSVTALLLAISQLRTPELVNNASYPNVDNTFGKHWVYY